MELGAAVNVAGLGELVDQAWPALERVDFGPWTFRASHGVTKRANSVLVRGVPEALREAVEAAEAFYGERGLPCVFSVGSGVVDDFLAARGYSLVDPTVAMWASGAVPYPTVGPGGGGAVPYPSAGSGGSGAGPYGVVGAGGQGEAVPYRIVISREPGEGWMRTWWAVDGGRFPEQQPVAAEILTGVPSLYAAYEEDGEVLAVGRGVPQGDTLGIYCVAVLPRARRRGLARAVLRGLRAHAGLGSAYLVVTERNAGARELYRGEGFVEAGGYHYRVAPQQR